MVKRSIDHKLRLRNFDAWHGRMETGSVVKNRKGTSGVEGGRGTCYQWKEKSQCSKGDRCSFRHESNDRAQKPERTAATPSEPSFSRGRSVSKKKSIHGKSNRGSILRQTCRYPSVNSTKQKRAAKQGISVCSRILVCILEASESTRLRMGESLPNHHEDHIA